MSHYSNSGTESLAALIILVVVMGVECGARATGACTVPEDRVRDLVTLTVPDAEEVVPGDYRWWACGEGDWHNAGFTVTTGDGRERSGTVCCGLSVLKDCTVRWR